jgi:tetratricopeptide (TPR) repeat protein
MWDLAVREDDYQAAAAMVQRMKAPPLSMRVLLTFASGDAAARASIVEEARVFDSRQSQIGARFVATFLENFAAAESLARLDLADRRRPPIRVTAQTFIAWLEVARGRWSAARTAFADAEAMPEGVPTLYQRATAASLPFLNVPRADLEAIRAELATSNPDADTTDPGASLSARLQPHLRLYLLALLSSRLGDFSSAATFVRDLERTSVPAEARDVVRGMAATVRADIATQGGAPAVTLDVTPGSIPLELVSVPLFANVREFTLEHARFVRVIQLAANGDFTSALQAMETGFQGSPGEFVFLAPLHEQRARIHEQLGDRQKAIEHYRRLVQLWGDADPALQPRVEAARAAITRLERSGI